MESLGLHCSHSSHTAQNGTPSNGKETEIEGFMRFNGFLWAVFFPIDNPEDLPFEKSKKFTKQPLGLSHGRMNERDVGTAHGANATLMQGSKRRRIARAGAAIVC